MRFSRAGLLRELVAMAWRSRSPEALRSWQRRRLTGLLRHAWDRSPFHRALWQGAGMSRRDLEADRLPALPITTKAQLRERFDDVVCDRRLTRELVERWSSLPPTRRDGLLPAGTLMIHTSGTEGRPVWIPHGSESVEAVLANAVLRLRGDVGPTFRRRRYASVLMTDGGYAGEALLALAPWRFHRHRTFSVAAPENETAAELEAWDPHVLCGYASAVHRLAGLALAGELSIRPIHVSVGGDCLSEAMVARIREAWGCGVTDCYSSSEALCIAARLQGDDSMRIFGDLVMLEILDDRGEEVAPGESGRVILTNLANPVFPTIRFDTGDRAVRGHPVGGCPFDRIEALRGRSADWIAIRRDDGEEDRFLPRIVLDLESGGLPILQFVEIDGGIEIRHEGDVARGEELRAMVEVALAGKRALGGTTLRVRAVPVIPPDPTTGKHRLVIRRPSGS